MLMLRLRIILLQRLLAKSHARNKRRCCNEGLSMNAHCIIIELQQGTRDWREWRHKGIGSSDASIIMGESKFKRPWDLLQEKRRLCQDCPSNQAMARGIEDEPDRSEEHTSELQSRFDLVCR